MTSSNAQSVAKTARGLFGFASVTAPITHFSHGLNRFGRKSFASYKRGSASSKSAATDLPSRLTATKYLEQLCREGFLRKQKLGRANFYINDELFSLLSKVGTETYR